MTPTRQTPYDDHVDHRIDAVLRDLDSGGTIDEATRIRADAALERILATPAPTATTRRAGSRRRALWLLPVAGATALAAVVAIPAMTGHDAPAYASWSKTPSPVPAAELADATRACQNVLREDERRAVDIPAEHRPDVRADTAKVVLSERRGNYVFVALATDSGAELSCLRKSDGSMGASGSSPSVGGPKPAPLAADQVEANGPGYSGGPEGAYAQLQGRVGRDVRAIVVHAQGPDGRDLAVDATVTGGRFAAWWPVRADSSADTRFDDTILQFTIDVTLADGTVRRNAPVSGLPPQRKAPGPREVGKVTRGGGAGPDGEFESVEGAVGAEVVGVIVHVDGRSVPATLAPTGFTARYRPTPRTAPATGEPPAPTFDLTLRDGTVVRGVKAVS